MLGSTLILSTLEVVGIDLALSVRSGAEGRQNTLISQRESGGKSFDNNLTSLLLYCPDDPTYNVLMFFILE